MVTCGSSSTHPLSRTGKWTWPVALFFPFTLPPAHHHLCLLRLPFHPKMGYLPSLSTVFQFFGGVIVLGLASTAGLLYRYQRTLIYPSSFPQGSRTEVLSPSEFGIPFTEEHLNTPDGETLRAFVMLQQAPSEKEIEKGATLNDEPSTTARRRPTIIFLHANAGNMVSARFAVFFARSCSMKGAASS